MRVLLLNEDDVRRLLSMDEALAAVEEGLRKLALDEAENISRARARTDHAVLHVMGAAAKTLGFMGAKIYSSHRKNGAQFLLPLFDGKSGALLALIQADYLGRMRTGAASGVATKYLARADASEVGILGSGQQARTQLQAVCKVRNVRQVHVYSRSDDHRRRFAAEMSEQCGIEVIPVNRPEPAAEEKDIIITATDSREPVLSAHWIRPGVHINAVGSNALGRVELEPGVVRRCTLVVVDSKDQARIEAGDFQQPLEDGTLRWEHVRELGQVIVGRYALRRQPQDITLFKSLGIAIEDVAVAGRVYTKAVAENVGQWIEW